MTLFTQELSSNSVYNKLEHIQKKLQPIGIGNASKVLAKGFSERRYPF